MNKLIKMCSFVAYFAVAVFSTNASAALVIDFGTGIGTGGTLTVDGNGDVTGSNIFIGALNVSGAVQNNGGYTVNALLNFSTAANNINVIGTVGSLGITASETLLTGSFNLNDWSIFSSGATTVFSGAGIDTKSANLLTALGADVNTQFEFFGFSLESINGIVVSTDIVNTAVVPVPAAVWLFGSGLIGLVGVARRKALVA